MGTGYTRADVSNNIADGNIINASDIDSEYDAIEAAFNSSTGHTHDGTSAEGGPITVLGPVQDFVASATEIKPKTTNTLDIGTSGLQFKDLYLDGTAYIDGLGEDILVATDKKVQFRDTALFINSSTDGQLDIDADVEVEITAPTLDINASTAVTIDTATLTITGSANVTGDLDVDNININGNTISSTNTNGNITLAPNGTGVVALSSTDLTFGDNDKAIFGAGSDLQIYHDGSNSYVGENGTGSLILYGTQLSLTNGATDESYITCANNGGVRLYYDNAEKLLTTATGIDVTGTVTADGLTVSDGDFIKSDGSLIVDIDSDNNTTGAVFDIKANGNAKLIARFIENGDISFYDDTGVSQGLFWDASAESLGIGTTSPSDKLEIYTTSGDGLTLSRSGTAIGHIYDDANNFGIEVLNSNSITFDTGGSERMRIDNSGNVGIGTASPLTPLHISATSPTLWIQGGASGQSNINLGPSTDGDEGAIFYSQSSNALGFRAGAAERMRIDSNGQVGISGSTASFDTTGAVNGLQLYYESDSGLATVGSYSGGGSTELTFHTNSGGSASSEAMRIDASGNLLVGKTASNSISEGCELRDGASGSGFALTATSTDTTTLALNRKTSDGDTAVFRKDGSTFGSIGVGNSLDLYIGTSDTGLMTASSNNLIPWNPSTNAVRDSAIDLGSSSAKFKDLYLSGGVYVGGTGASNLLDDYEEGTFTPEYGGTVSNPTVTHDIQSGKYTKVGNLVTVAFQIGTDAATGGSGSLVVRGLPFSVDTTVYFRVVGYSFTGSNSTYNSDRPDIGFCEGATSRLRFWKADTTNVDCSFLNNTTNDNRILAVVSYYTS